MTGIPFSGPSEEEVDNQSRELEIAVADTDGTTIVDNLHLENSGTVFIVLKTKLLAEAVTSAVEFPDRYDPDDPDTKIQLHRCTRDPHMIKWENFYVSWRDFGRRLLVSAAVLSGVITLWFLLYVPFAHMAMTIAGSTYQGSWLEQKVATQGEQTAGLFIAVGNCIVSTVVVSLSEYVGFTREGAQHLTELAVLIPCIALNCVLDFLITTFAAARTLTAGMAFEQRIELLQQQIYTLLFPSYIIIPYIAEPIATILFPKFLAIWRAKRDARVTPSDAEKAMIPAQTDICVPMADIICTPATILATFLLAPSAMHRKLMPLICVFAVVLYLQSRLRILRWESFKYYGSKHLHVCESVFWIVPLGLLAAAWERQYKNMAFVYDLTGWKWFCAHAMAHLIYLFLVLPAIEPKTPMSPETYYNTFLSSESGTSHHTGLANYQNTNPVEVLKHENTVLFRLDKEHLQERAVQLDQATIDLKRAEYRKNHGGALDLLAIERRLASESVFIARDAVVKRAGEFELVDPTEHFHMLSPCGRTTKLQTDSDDSDVSF
eukprot:TRINITY_DN94778_c0_g1_i1.p1 TRINITY_DN94778_c0_g1~~TRINITY_DN94778_c0_g1_i1.p1  ORF type:complete len:638 (+),score=68.10 TRINITY_DN94778_c0_g1_i1:272-1915(+)